MIKSFCPVLFDAIALDVVPTLLDTLGVTTQKKMYTQGVNLFNGRGHDYIVISSWSTCAVRTSDAVFVFSLKSYKANYFDIFDPEYKLIHNEDAILRKYNPTLLTVMKEFNRFIK